MWFFFGTVVIRWKYIMKICIIIKESCNGGVSSVNFTWFVDYIFTHTNNNVVKQPTNATSDTLSSLLYFERVESYGFQL